MKTHRKTERRVVVARSAVVFWSAAARRRFGSERSFLLSLRGAPPTNSGSAANESCARPQHSQERRAGAGAKKTAAPDVASGVRSACALRRSALAHRPGEPLRQAQGGGARAGTTLTEVLISMLIMSFGIATVATLFPVSALRSAQAVKLTNATILRYNAESLIDMEPALIHNPDYNTGATSVSEHNNTNYIVDPLGWNMLPTTTVVGALKFRDFFGNDGNGNAYNPTLPVRGLRRFAGGRSNPPLASAAAALTAAESFVSLPDSWTLLNEGTATAAGTNAAGQVVDVTLSDDTDITDVASIVSAGTQVRLTIFDADARHSQSRVLSSNTVITGQKIEWKSASSATELVPLPAHMPAAQIGRVQIEIQERRYTWLLTVRKGSTGSVADASVDVVVFFKRDLTEADETVYQAAFVKNQNTATITYNSNIEVPFKKGAWVLDVNNAQWYRVQEIVAGATSGSTASVTITLDRSAQAASPAGGAGRAMFPRGIVDVYPIGTKAFVAP